MSGGKTILRPGREHRKGALNIPGRSRNNAHLGKRTILHPANGFSKSDAHREVLGERQPEFEGCKSSAEYVMLDAIECRIMIPRPMS